MPARRRVRTLTGFAAAGGLAAATAGLALYGRSGGVDSSALFAAELMLVLGGLGLLVVSHQPRNRLGLFYCAGALLVALQILAVGTLRDARVHGGVPATIEQAAYFFVWLSQSPAPWVAAILVFPDGRFPGRGWCRFFVGSTAAGVLLSVAEYLLASGGRMPSGLPAVARATLEGPFAAGGWGFLFATADTLSLVLPVVALAGLIGRFRRAPQLVRQQIKWLLTGAVLSVLASVLALRLGGAAGSALLLVTAPLPAVGAAVGILRYRLWEIDLVISRALVYGLLWAAVSTVLLVPALAAGLAVGGSPALAALGLALVVTLVLQPARARLERLVERLVYGSRPRGYALLTQFGETLRAAVEVEELAPRLAGVVRTGLGTEWAAVWVYVESGGTGALRAVGGAGLDPGPSLLLSQQAAAELQAGAGRMWTDDAPMALRELWTRPPAAVTPLVAGDELVGLLACGQRPGDPLSDPDRELLALVARESALALRNLRLEAQLRERLEQIEEQAGELRRSRQRLVSVQDAERRRIERDLHDGVQQQLVTLAAKLRRASLAAGADVHLLLADLAAEAEATMFDLQELGRGIFPSALADHGLAAALRTQAERVPMAVHVEVEPSLAGRRFDREVETALYFVGLEALANARKHAPSAAVKISLRADGHGLLVLDVHDDGPGFDAARVGEGTGVQNMTDRIAAIGGALRVESRPGAGTWLRAEAPFEAELIALQRFERDSLR